MSAWTEPFEPGERKVSWARILATAVVPLLVLLGIYALASGGDSKCTKIEKAVRAAIEDARKCQPADECVVASFDCPFGCGSVIRKSALPEIQRLKKSYEGCKHCAYDCYFPPGPASCVKGYCVRTPTK